MDLSVFLGLGVLFGVAISNKGGVYIELHSTTCPNASFGIALGIVAQEQRKWEQAEGYFQHALQIKVEYNDRYSQASTYHHLGMVAQEQRKWEQARALFMQALGIFQEYNDQYSFAITLNGLAQLWHASNDPRILEPIASVLQMSQEEVEQLLQTLLDNPS
jgi:tetratricopeptide (TPR) repeat protein